MQNFSDSILIILIINIISINANCYANNRKLPNKILLGRVICKDPAEIATAIFTKGNVLQQNEMNRVFVKPGTEFELFDR
uniref:Uncharacterized protein n=1 Tax=viral metagenome TaxID=1070528 RepID=A0A6C0CA31_9ZZZZ